jgi:thiamine-monophosphate kinase
MSISEFDIIGRFFTDSEFSRPDVLLGIGDDCALLQPPPGYALAVSTDTLVEGIHFFAGTDAEALGHKSLAVSLSDLAAMGAQPCWASLALTLPEGEADEAWLAAFSDGFLSLARQHNLQLIGGDTTSGPLSITVTIHGLVKASEALKRSTAAVGDCVFVSGRLGDAALALEQLQRNELPAVSIRDALELPDPRVRLGMALVGIATACIDISDGLLADLGHICEASGCAAEIQRAKLPISSEMRTYIQKKSDWSKVLAGGDDYELCFTAPETRRQAISALADELGIVLTEIGLIRSGDSIHCFDESGKELKLTHTGYQHFHE